MWGRGDVGVDTKWRSVFPFLNSSCLYALVFSDDSVTTLHRTLRGSGKGVLEESAFAKAEEREVEPFYIGRWGTKTVCDGFGESAQKEGFVGSLVVSPKGFGPDAGKKQKPIKECDSSGLSGLNNE